MFFGAAKILARVDLVDSRGQLYNVFFNLQRVVVGVSRYYCAKLARSKPIKERFSVSAKANELRLLPVQVGYI